MIGYNNFFSLDIFDNEESDDAIEIPEEEPVTHLTVEKPVITVKGKKRKAIDTTYQDEDGYLGMSYFSDMGPT